MSNHSDIIRKIFDINKNYNGLVDEANIEDVKNQLTYSIDDKENIQSTNNLLSQYSIDQQGGNYSINIIRKMFIRQPTHQGYQYGGNNNTSDELDMESDNDEKYKVKYYKYKTKYFKVMADNQDNQN